MKKNNAGFTLIEVLTVIGIIGLATAIAVPTLLNVLPNWRAKSAASDLFGNLQLAKMAAIRRGTDCVVTFTGKPDAAVPCQYQISIINKTVSLDDYGSQVVFRGPVAGPIYPRFNADDGVVNSWSLTFNSRGMVTGNSIFVYFSSMQYQDTDPDRHYYRAGASTAGVVQMNRYNRATGAWE